MPATSMTCMYNNLQAHDNVFGVYRVDFLGRVLRERQALGCGDMLLSKRSRPYVSCPGGARVSTENITTRVRKLRT